MPQPLFQMEDTVRGGSGGSMKSLRTTPDHDLAGLNLLAHLSGQAQEQRGLFYQGPSETRTIGPVPVKASVPRRVKGEHTTKFAAAAGGQRSATKYQEELGTRSPGIKYNITHGVGHGEGGAISQQIDNLASASEGANTEMIPFDKAISGNPNVLVNTSFNMRAGTHRAEWIDQRFAHKDYPDEPFHVRRIDADRPPPTRSEYGQMEDEAGSYAPEALEAAATLRGLRTPMKKGIDGAAKRRERAEDAAKRGKNKREELLAKRRAVSSAEESSDDEDMGRDQDDGR